MALITCPECGKKISDTVDSCPSCGYKLSSEIKTEIKKKEKKSKRGCAIGCASVIGLLLISFCVIGIIITPIISQRHEQIITQEDIHQQQKVSLEYRITHENDFSIGVIKRKEYRVQVPHVSSEDDLSLISNQIIRKTKSQEKGIRVIVIFFYLQDYDPIHGRPFAKATWAPGGEIANAVSNPSLSPKLVIENWRYNIVPEESIVDLPDDDKKRILFQLVVFQDQGMDIEMSHEETAKMFGITRDQVVKIQYEGAQKGWPMPE